MTSAIDVFQTAFLAHISLSQILLFTLTLCLLWGVEAYVSGEPTADKWAHTATNAFLILTALPLQLLFNAALGVLTSVEQEFHWGIARFFPDFPNVWVEYLVMFLVFDLLDYIYHRAMHQIPGLWRFHLVHHTDTVMDVSTTLREHPGETVLRNGFLLIGVLVPPQATPSPVWIPIRAGEWAVRR